MIWSRWTWSERAFRKLGSRYLALLTGSQYSGPEPRPLYCLRLAHRANATQQRVVASAKRDQVGARTIVQQDTVTGAADGVVAATDQARPRMISV